LEDWGVELPNDWGNNVDIDDLFTDNEVEKNQDVTIKVIIPKDQEEIKGDVIRILNTALKDFETIKIQ
jgi:hypothetical protein